MTARTVTVPVLLLVVQLCLGDGPGNTARQPIPKLPDSVRVERDIVSATYGEREVVRAASRPDGGRTPA